MDDDEFLRHSKSGSGYLLPSTQVRIVPVTRVNYDWKGRGRSYYVYGYENKVHLPGGSYPDTCCWGCTVM